MSVEGAPHRSQFGRSIRDPDLDRTRPARLSSQTLLAIRELDSCDDLRDFAALCQKAATREGWLQLT